MKLMALMEDSLDSTTSLHLRQNNVDGMEYGAIFDVNDRYRYSLWRAWSAHHPRIAFVLLNPSTADEQRNDPTIRRCMGFARAWNFGSMEVVNLFGIVQRIIESFSRLVILLAKRTIVSFCMRFNVAQPLFLVGVTGERCLAEITRLYSCLLVETMCIAWV